MVENSPLKNVLSGAGLNPVGGVGAARDFKRDVSLGEGGAAFQALLEKLQASARSLQQDSETVVNPEDLSEAVDRARTSLTTALSLSDQLLEAYRESTQREAANSPSTDGTRDSK